MVKTPVGPFKHCDAATVQYTSLSLVCIRPLLQTSSIVNIMFWEPQSKLVDFNHGQQSMKSNLNDWWANLKPEFDELTLCKGRQRIFLNNCIICRGKGQSLRWVGAITPFIKHRLQYLRAQIDIECYEVSYHYSLKKANLVLLPEYRMCEYHIMVMNKNDRPSKWN
jgi:hypothetical protein